MPISLAFDSSSDAAVTDGLGRGDLACAARLWVRHWPAAVTVSRLYVDPAEVPGLAAEALIGTLSLIAMGRGPREDVTSFVTEAVRELGDDQRATPDRGPELPPVFASAILTGAFADLPIEDQRSLQAAARDDEIGPVGWPSLTVLQTSYLTNHLDRAPANECRAPHIAMLAAANSSAAADFATRNWLHLSTCAWCTEAFHELAFSNVALAALVSPAVFEAVVPVPEAVVPVPEPAPFLSLITADQSEEPTEAFEPTASVGGIAAGLRDTRYRLVAIGIAVAVVTVVGLLIGQSHTPGAEPTAPVAASEPSNGSALPDPTPSNTPSSVGAVTPTTVAVAGPTRSSAARLNATPRATPSPAATRPAPEPSEQPSSPAPTSAPTTSTPTPTPAPTPTPTPHCYPVQHLLGFC